MAEPKNQKNQSKVAEEVLDQDLEACSGGFNPQPDPPSYGGPDAQPLTQDLRRIGRVRGIINPDI